MAMRVAVVGATGVVGTALVSIDSTGRPTSLPAAVRALFVAG